MITFEILRHASNNITVMIYKDNISYSANFDVFVSHCKKLGIDAPQALSADETALVVDFDKQYPSYILSTDQKSQNKTYRAPSNFQWPINKYKVFIDRIDDFIPLMFNLGPEFYPFRDQDKTNVPTAFFKQCCSIS